MPNRPYSPEERAKACEAFDAARKQWPNESIIETTKRVAQARGMNASTLSRWLAERRISAKDKNRIRALESDIRAKDAEIADLRSRKDPHWMVLLFIGALIGALVGMLFQRPSITDYVTFWSRGLRADLTPASPEKDDFVIKEGDLDVPSLQKAFSGGEPYDLYKNAYYINGFNFNLKMTNAGASQLRITDIAIIDQVRSDPVTGNLIAAVPQGGRTSNTKVVAYADDTDSSFYDKFDMAGTSPKEGAEPVTKKDTIELDGYQTYQLSGTIETHAKTVSFRVQIKYVLFGREQTLTLQDLDRPYQVSHLNCVGSPPTVSYARGWEFFGSSIKEVTVAQAASHRQLSC